MAEKRPALAGAILSWARAFVVARDAVFGRHPKRLVLAKRNLNRLGCEIRDRVKHIPFSYNALLVMHFTRMICPTCTQVICTLPPRT